MTGGSDRGSYFIPKKIPTSELGRDPFNQNSNRSDREKRTTSKGGPVFSKLFRLDRTDPLSFGPKFPESLVEWIAPLVYQKKSLLFFSIPKKIPQCFCISKFYYLSSEIDTSLYGFINHFGKLDVMLLIFSRELLHTTKMGSQLTGPLSSCWNSTALTPGLSLVYKSVFLPLFLHSNVII